MFGPESNSSEGHEVPETIDRRVHARYTCALETFFQPGKGQLDRFWRRARVQDLSATGIGLLLNIQFQVGTLLTVELVNQDQSYSQELQARVIRVQKLAPGVWKTGCAFDRTLCAEELQALLSGLLGDEA